jgi:hypothetical protein
MKKRAFITSLPCFGISSLVVAADTVAQPGLKLVAESCAAQDPGSMWHNHVTMHRSESSEQDQTEFYQAYAKSLGEWTELKHPETRQIRLLIHEAWTQAMEFIVVGVWGGVAHVLRRLPAETEWVIWDGYNRGFDRAYVGRYQHQTITHLLSMIFEANAEAGKKLADSVWHIEKCLTALGEAEKLLPEQGHYYFRSHLIKRLGDCL